MSRLMNSTTSFRKNSFKITNRPNNNSVTWDFGRSESERSLTKLQSAFQRLEEQNEQLRSLASLTAHQLKTPLMSLIWQTEKMKLDCCHEPRQQYCIDLEKIDFCARQIKQQFEDILGYGLGKNVRTTDCLQSIIESIVYNIRPVKKIRFNITGSKAWMNFDRFTLHTIFQNLIVNALEHATQEILEFALEIVLAEECIRINYKDNSPGIPEHDWLAAKSKKQYHGKGLGLMIIHQVASFAKIKIWLDQKPNGGIHLEIPFRNN
jgi:signal transduction histidine kinase